MRPASGALDGAHGTHEASLGGQLAIDAGFGLELPQPAAYRPIHAHMQMQLVARADRTLKARCIDADKVVDRFFVRLVAQGLEREDRRSLRRSSPSTGRWSSRVPTPKPS